ncbi:formyltransferase family protein [Methylobacterium nodulans]|uniref:Formyl transferase domain protein n=1 Tax=Methylobacterium nodulans (strain LMG 21967 / CNCM I-2342 / ORS 2060) TaxID=460265 RepID=B8IT46_METNO|nr:formyltransferase family protein [Methylobacterium nodulans]ACL56932.1 formyl transferase domain protein [Methylobacterium nodulans ORS 2060]
MRIALFTLEALANARAVRRFVADHAGEIAVVGLSDPERPGVGGLTGQVRRHLLRSGPGFLPYLAVNFGLPDLLRGLAPATQRLGGSLDVPEATPLHSLCNRLGLPHAVIEDVNAPGTAALLAEHRADLIVSFHFDQIFAAATLAAVPLGGINLHPSLLPRFRGPVPTFHALLDETPTFGVTVHRLAPAIDAGGILAQEAVTLPGDVTASRAAMQLHEAGRPLLDRVLAEVRRDGRIPAGRALPLLPYCGFPTRAQLRDLKRRGRRLVDARDLGEALSLSVRR